MAVNIICDECGCSIDDGEDVICRRCHNAGVDRVADKLQEKIDELEEELAEIKSQLEL